MDAQTLDAVLFAVVTALYAFSFGGFVSVLLRGSQRVEQLAVVVLGIALVAQLVRMSLVVSQSSLGGVQGLFAHRLSSVVAFAIGVAYLGARRFQRVSLLGAFVTPIALLLFVGSGLAQGSVLFEGSGSMAPGVPVPPHWHSALLPVHIGANVFGVAAFALACATAAAYLIQERLLRSKRVSGLFQRLPDLQALDRWSLRMDGLGFGLLTLGVVTGAMVTGSEFLGSLTVSRFVGLFCWVFFGSVLFMRVVAGWQGRRAAVGTVVGFVGLLVVLVGYAIGGSGVEG